ncbi:glycosyl hydrolase [Aspergillus pseudodeflectus]|uniref:Glycosyl hydrolase n=1 Tax=Aspergillus pseudodeflectus TaxID=176178 RepID=A0ABR4JEU9_9EURO
MSSPTTPISFRNPIIPGFNPDPSIIRVRGDYFLVTSTFEYFPGIPIYHSTDLLNWKAIGHVLTRREQLDMRTTEPSGGIWAPTIRYRTEGKRDSAGNEKGRFYVSVGCTQRFRPREWDIVIPRGFYVTTDDIWAPGAWSDPVYFDVPGIDQDLFFDTNGKTYLSAVNQITQPGVDKHALGLATFTVEIDLATGRCLAKPAWNCISHHGIGIAEGPHIFRHDGYYYLSTAEGGTDEGHQQWIRRSKVGPLGPWEEPNASEGLNVNPMIFNGDDEEIRCTGHLDFVENGNGDWFAVFLGVRVVDGRLSTLGRETFLAPVQWRDGWPVVNGGARIGLEMEMAAASSSPGAHDAPIKQDIRTSWRDDFDSPELQLGWYHLRTPLKREYSLTKNPGNLSLYGNAYRIYDSECPSMLLQKQMEVSVDWRVGMHFDPENPLEEAGTAIWWSQFAYASIGLRRSVSGDGVEVFFRGQGLMLMMNQENIHPLQSNTEIQLLIRARPTKYELLFSPSDSDDFTKLGEISSAALTVRHPGRESPNTGAHFAIYAQGAYAMPCLQPAVFRFAEWRAV